MDILINNVIQNGVRIGKDFFDTLHAPLEAKDYIFNESRLENGVRVCPAPTRFKKRSFTLEFQIVAKTKEQLEEYKDSFFQALYGLNTISFSDRNESYRLLYTGRSSSYSSGLSGEGCKVKIGFDEPNPSYRGMSVSVTGGASDINVFTNSHSYPSVRAIALKENTIEALNIALPNATSGTNITTAQSAGDSLSIGGWDKSGKYYIGVKAFSENGEELASSISNAVYFLGAVSATSFNGVFSTDGTNFNPVWTMINGVTAPASQGSISIKVSNDATKGNIMVDAFCGVSFSSPAYGVFDYDLSKIVIPYTNTPNYVVRQVGHYFCQGDTVYANASDSIELLINDTSVYGSLWPIVCPKYIYDKYPSSNDYGAWSRIYKMVCTPAGTPITVD